MKSLLQGATLLSLICHASCLLNQRADPSKSSCSSRNPPRSMVSAIDRSSSRSSGTKAEDLFAQAITQRASETKSQRRIRSPSAPRVDSALLRFLSTQKLQREARVPSDTEREMIQAHLELQRLEEQRRLIWSPTGRYLDTLKKSATETAAIMPTRRYQNALAPPKRRMEQIPLANQRVIALRAADTTDSWMGQYNAHRVAQLLVSHSVEGDAAMEAGISVQSHVLARTARRRVQEFLKRRDKLWVDTKNEKLLDTPGGFFTSDGFENGIEEVVNLLLSFGLTGKDIAAILQHTPGIALMKPRRANNEVAAKGTEGGETLEETTKRAYEGILCESLQLRKYDARKVMRACPGLLTKRGSTKAEQVVTLLTSLGVSKKALAREINALPMLLVRSPSEIFRLVSFLASDVVKMPVKNIGPLLRRIECIELLNAVAPVMGINDSEVQRIGENNLVLDDDTATSAFLGRRVEARRERINEIYRNMTRTAQILRDEIGTKDLGKIIAAYPAVLLQDAELQILPCASYLMHDLGIWEDDLPSVLQLYPVLLGTKLSQLQRVVRFLKSLDIEEENMASIFRAFPALLTMDIEQQMIPVIHFLQEIGIANLGRFIIRLPPVLGYSVERELRPKWEYLSKVCLYPSFELSTFPAYFSYPLDRVIKARYEYLYEIKRTPSQLLALDVVLRYGDKDFAGQVAKDDDRGAAFASFVEGRQNGLKRKPTIKGSTKGKSDGIRPPKRNESSVKETSK